jgi:small-conductance mechanosensitive channel
MERRGAITVDFEQVLEQLEEMLQALVERVPAMLVALALVIVFTFLALGTGWTVRQVVGRRHRNLGKVLGRLANWLIIVLGVLIGLVVIFPNFTPAQLIQLLGVAGLAISFAFRDILENFMAGILLLITEPYRIGDQIVVGDFEGTVEDIHTRATTIRTYDGRRVVIPNATLFTDQVIVNTAYEKRRIEYDFGIGYGDDIERARQLVLQLLRESPVTVDDPAPDVLVIGLDPYQVTLRARWWIYPPRRADALDARNEVLLAIKNRLLAAGIDLPYPTQQILLHDQTEATDGDRRRQREGWPAGPGAAPEPRRAQGAGA